MATGALVLGIIALVLSFIPVVNFLAIPLAVVGIILGALGSKQLQAQGMPTGQATAGLVLSIIALVFAIIFTIACWGCAACAAQPFIW